MKKRFQQNCFPGKFAAFSRPLSAASEFSSSSSVINIKCISNQCIKVSVWLMVWCIIHSMIMLELVKGSSKNMFGHAILSHLVFKHGFIQLSFGVFGFLVFASCVTNTYLILLNFTRYIFSVNIIFLLIRNLHNETWILS